MKGRAGACWLDPDIGNYRTGDVLIEGLTYESRAYVVSKAGFAMPAI